MVQEERFSLQRFVSAQQGVYEIALQEIKSGRKETHWMWFIFPQLKGLGTSSMSEFYGLSGEEEAKAYLAHPLLGKRLHEITAAVLELKDRSPEAIFGYPDSLKFKSCMQIFASASQDELNLFNTALKQFTY